MASQSAIGSDPVASGETTVASRSGFVLAVLMAASVVSLLDRQLLSLLFIPISADLGLSDFGVSLLQGFAFAALYAFAGLPMGWWADRHNRRNLIIFGVTMWSVMTALCGLADSFLTLFLARVGVGLGEACLHPAAYSMICDLFPPERRGRAYALFGAAATLGIAISLFAGAAVIGVLAGVGDIVLPFGTLALWKAAFLVASVPGLVVAVLLLLFVREPERRERLTRSGGGFLPFLRSRSSAIAVAFAVYGLINFAGYGVLAWAATAYVRLYGMTIAQGGITLGVILLIGTIAGAPLGGYLSDRWVRKGRRGGGLLVPVMSGSVGALAFAGWWLTHSYVASIAFGGLAFAMQIASTATAPSVIAALAPNEFRGQLAALYLLLTGLFGIAAGPSAIALVTDQLFGRPEALREALILVPVPAVLAAALLAWTCGRRFMPNAQERPAIPQPLVPSIAGAG